MIIKNILKDCIQKYYPELTNKKIKIVYQENADFLFACSGVIGFGHTIYYSNDYYKMNTEAIAGGICHELSHISSEYQNGILWYFFDRIISIIPKYLTYRERQTDLDVIKRGAGNYLLQLQKYHDRFYEKYSKYDGLTKKEIRKRL